MAYTVIDTDTRWERYTLLHRLSLHLQASVPYKTLTQFVWMQILNVLLKQRWTPYLLLINYSTLLTDNVVPELAQIDYSCARYRLCVEGISVLASNTTISYSI